MGDIYEMFALRYYICGSDVQAEAISTKNRWIKLNLSDAEIQTIKNCGILVVKNICLK